jgi:hypothetical protein
MPISFNSSNERDNPLPPPVQKSERYTCTPNKTKKRNNSSKTETYMRNPKDRPAPFQKNKKMRIPLYRRQNKKGEGLDK